MPACAGRWRWPSSPCSAWHAQITVGFYALDRLGLEAAAAARVAGIALTLVGVALVLAQLLARRLGVAPQRMIRIGGLLAAVGFASAGWVSTVGGLWACYFVSAAGMGWVFPAFAALAANAWTRRWGTAGAIGAAQSLGMVAGPLIGTLLYAAGDRALPAGGRAVAGDGAWPGADRRPSPR